MANSKVDAASVLMNGIEMVNNASKVAANLSKRPPEKKTYNEGDTTNQPHTQTVEVKVGEQGTPKPVVVHEKKETHIHKPYPDSRNLTKEECEVETLRIKLEAEDKKAEREYRMWLEEKYREERREREENARKERDRRREEDKKFARRVFICAGIAGAIGVGCYAYSCYTSSRRSASCGLVLPASKAATIEADGAVK